MSRRNYRRRNSAPVPIRGNEQEIKRTVVEVKFEVNIEVKTDRDVEQVTKEFECKPKGRSGRSGRSAGRSKAAKIQPCDR